MNRRESLQTMGLAAAALMIPQVSCTNSLGKKTRFRYCLNTSTIRGQQQGLLKDIDTAARTGYDSLELWVRDVQAYIKDGHTIGSLNTYIRDAGLEVANAIGFAPWLSDDDEISRKGFTQMREEMELMADLGCSRIAAPPAGQFIDPELDLFQAGEKFRRLIALGRETGVMPQLEFWGASPVLFHMGQIMMIAAVAGENDVKLLPDVYHMFRGGSSYETLRMLQGNTIDIFHINDFPGDKPRIEQVDADRVMPGDGAAPMQQIVDDLYEMGGVKYLSLELFNPGYWQQDAQEVANLGLLKMKAFTQNR